jgi:hypothetical protein
VEGGALTAVWQSKYPPRACATCAAHFQPRACRVLNPNDLGFPRICPRAFECPPPESPWLNLAKCAKASLPRPKDLLKQNKTCGVRGPSTSAPAHRGCPCLCCCSCLVCDPCSAPVLCRFIGRASKAPFSLLFVVEWTTCSEKTPACAALMSAGLGLGAWGERRAARRDPRPLTGTRPWPWPGTGTGTGPAGTGWANNAPPARPAPALRRQGTSADSELRGSSAVTQQQDGRHK